MRNFSFCIVLLCSCFVSVAQEIVYHKNGSIIKGDIVEIKPNQSLKVATGDGSLFVCNFDDIEKITRTAGQHVLIL